jgi:hypothetical protein
MRVVDARHEEPEESERWMSGVEYGEIDVLEPFRVGDDVDFNDLVVGRAVEGWTAPGRPGL